MMDMMLANDMDMTPRNMRRIMVRNAAKSHSRFQRYTRRFVKRIMRKMTKCAKRGNGSVNLAFTVRGWDDYYPRRSILPRPRVRLSLYGDRINCCRFDRFRRSEREEVMLECAAAIMRACEQAGFEVDAPAKSKTGKTTWINISWASSDFMESLALVTDNDVADAYESADVPLADLVIGRANTLSKLLGDGDDAKRAA